MRQSERQEYIVKRAYQLADSGAHISSITIIATLEAAGYHDARTVLDNTIIRDDLNSICAAPWAVSDLPDYVPAGAMAIVALADERDDRSPALPQRSRRK